MALKTLISAYECYVSSSVIKMKSSISDYFFQILLQIITGNYSLTAQSGQKNVI